MWEPDAVSVTLGVALWQALTLKVPEVQREAVELGDWESVGEADRQPDSVGEEDCDTEGLEEVEGECETDRLPPACEAVTLKVPEAQREEVVLAV